MRHRSLLSIGAGLLTLSGVMTAPALAQCEPDWLPSEGQPGVTGELGVAAVQAWDPDGAGPAPEVLAVGGAFAGAGDINTFGMAIWDGAEWTSPGGGMNGRVRALGVYNGELIAGGDFTIAGGVEAKSLARWDGTTWRSMGAGVFGGPNPTVFGRTVYDGDLIAVGRFTMMDGAPANGIARWDGTSWHPLRGGAGQINGITIVTAATVFEGDLVIGGPFPTIDGMPVDGVARWNGESWSIMDDFHDVIEVHALTTYNGELIAGGSFRDPNTNESAYIVRWTGTAWEELGGGANDHVTNFAEYNGELIVGGGFTNIGGISAVRIARWNGFNWGSIPIGVRSVSGLAVYRNELYIGGTGSRPSGLRTALILRWDGIQANYVGDGIDGVVYDLESYNGTLIAAGSFIAVEENPVISIAARVGDRWEPLGPEGVIGGERFVYDMVVYDGSLIVSGSFTAIGGVPANSIARWDGEAWAPFGDRPFISMMVHEGDLYGVGVFDERAGVGRWNPKNQTWEPLGSFLTNSGLAALTFHNGAFYAGGLGGIGVNHSVWRWDGANWIGVGQHLGYATVQKLISYDGDLIAGGYFGDALMRFNGTAWERFSGGVFENEDDTLVVFDMETHNGDLYVAGNFSHAGAPAFQGVPAHNVARWDGKDWHMLGEGTNDAPVCLQVHDGALAMGGWFFTAGGLPAGHVASWGCAKSECAPDFNADGVLNTQDFFDFLGAFFNEDAAADFNADGSVNSQDFFDFIAAFFVGCEP